MKNDVLIIEDLDSDFEMVERGFRRVEKAPARLVRLRGVREACRFIDDVDAESVPGLVILDLVLEDGSGCELLETIKSRPAWEKVPVIVWSAYTEPGVRDECLRVGAHDFIPKAADSRVTRQNIADIASEWEAKLLSF